jgi:hypothetical protein
MKTNPFLLGLFATLLAPAVLHAQATRTWVSGVGDDANPCSRTAPGKTFAGAISKTAAGGVISVLDPGAFSAVTITKSITIDGGTMFAGILASGTAGIIINTASDTDVVILRNLDLEGAGKTAAAAGTIGIRILRAGRVHIENCRINAFQTAIDFASTSPGAQLFIDGCKIRTCSVEGVKLAGPADSFSRLLDTTVEGSTTGFQLTAGTAVLDRCSAVGNAAPGFDAGAGTKMTLNDCLSTGNTVGINSAGTVYLSDSAITNNVGAGLVWVKPAAIISLKNNRIGGNTPDGKVSKSLPLR